MTNFVREERYLLFKWADVYDSLSEGEIKILELLSDIVAEEREFNDKLPLKAVVIENDWPEYETVWGMIEDRMKNG